MHSQIDGAYPSGEDHLNTEQIVPYLDGELTEEEARAVHRHLEACWSCRQLSAEVAASIEAFIDFRSRLLHEDPARPPRAPQVFELQLHHYSLRQSAKESAFGIAGIWSWLRRHSEELSSSSLQPVSVGVVVALAALALLIHLKQEPIPVVSAAVVMERALVQEKRERPNTGQVVHRAVEVQHRGANGEWVPSGRIETWQASNQSVQRVFDAENRRRVAKWRLASGREVSFETPAAPNSAIGSLLKQVAWQNAPSVSDFASQGVDSKDIDLTVQPEEYVLSYHPGRTNSRPHLLNVTLTVRRSDLHATEETVVVDQNQRPSEYRMLEESFNEISDKDVAVDTFAIDSELTRGTVSPSPTGLASALLPAVDTGELAESELQVWLALDGVGGDTSSAVDIERDSNNHIVVSGILASEERKKELQQSLRAIPHVQLKIRTTGEVVAATTFDEHSSSNQIVEAVAPTLPPFDALLQKRFPQAEERREFEDQIITAIRLVAQETKVLDKLERTYGPQEASYLSSSSQEKLIALVREHVNLLQQQVQIVDMQLNVLQQLQPAGISTEASPKDWRATLHLLIPAVQLLRENVVIAISGSEQPGNDAATLALLIDSSRSRVDSLSTMLSLQVKGPFLLQKDK